MAGRDRRRQARHRTVRLAVVVAASVALAGCGSEAAAPSADNSAESTTPPPVGQTPTTTSDPPTEPTEDDSEPTEDDSQTPDPTPAPPTASGLPGTLLSAATLPGLNDEVGWRETATTPRESQRPGWVCQQFALVSNGAVTAVERRYAATAGTATATQVVGRTADRRSAERVFAVLMANAKNCADQLRSLDRFPRGAVEPLAPVPVSGGHAAAGVVFSGPVRGEPDAAYIDAVAVVQIQDLVAVVSMSSIGQDYDYPPGQAPAERAIPLVAAALGGS